MADMKLDDTLIMDQMEGTPSANPEDAAPKRVAHYHIERELGRGPLSVVYEAEDMHTGQKVALKLLMLSASLTPLEAEALIARFEREARTAARLSHPNIVHIHEVGAEQGQHFLAMEYLKGQTLRERMGKGSLPLPEAIAILTQIAGALDAVHKAGIVHRDVKPTNIILLPNGTAKLLDFGIACSSKETAITRRGMIIGSPSFMSPEQIKGDSGTKATDIWALGVLSCELLTGRLPFTGQNVGGVMFQIMHEAPALAPELPPAVQKVLLRALDKRPSQRYATAGAFIQALKLAYPKQVPTPAKQAPIILQPAPPASEQNPAALPQAAASSKPVKLSPAFPLPGPKWMPEAALLGLFVLGFSGAYLTRLHTDIHTQKAAASPPAARNVGQIPNSGSVQASAPTPVLPAPPPSAADPLLPDAAPAAAPSAPALSALPVQEKPEDRPAYARGPQVLPVTPQASQRPAKQAAAPVKPPHAAQAVAVVPAPPHQGPMNTKPAAPRHVPAQTASSPQNSAPVSRPAIVQVATRHLPVSVTAAPPAARVDRSEPEQTIAPARAAQPVPVQSVSQAATLPAEEDGYDPEADARRRKSAWSQEGAASQP